MEFRFSEEALAFEREVDEFLSVEWSPEVRRRVDASPDRYAMEREFRRKLAEKGWLTMSWPREYGGQERSYEEQYLFQEALNYVSAPGATVGVQQVGPTLMTFGTDEQKDAFLPRIAQGEIDFALGYTEPDAGTDLASLQLRAVRDGDDYVLNGIKRFTSAAHRAEYVWLAARTDPSAPKHRGISMFLVDLQTPGITVKPIWTMSGIRTNEVYWEDVRVPADALVGEENRGWYYAAHALDFERVSIFTVSGVRAVFDALMRWAREPGPDGTRPIDDGHVSRTLAGYKVQIEVLQMLAYRNLGMIKRGEHPNHEASEVKIFSTELMQRLLHTGTKLLGPYGQLTPESEHAPLGGRIEQGYRAAVMPTFGAGSNEVMRNIIATRGFGLPRG
ncbi:MAG: acyl-CoA dehydrogenase [Dehalococcoidia bacterium]|nr:acyl-CoA dehydrogenase [Dehalococcoidia bacterium]MYI86585.1 acyl-CoA dehydrogenase [Dehalococcoidia bacterium]